jgi:hypothetical protein
VARRFDFPARGCAVGELAIAQQQVGGLSHELPGLAARSAAQHVDEGVFGGAADRAVAHQRDDEHALQLERVRRGGGLDPRRLDVRGGAAERADGGELQGTADQQ